MSKNLTPKTIPRLRSGDFSWRKSLFASTAPLDIAKVLSY